MRDSRCLGEDAVDGIRVIEGHSVDSTGERKGNAGRTCSTSHGPE